MEVVDVVEVAVEGVEAGEWRVGLDANREHGLLVSGCPLVPCATGAAPVNCQSADVVGEVRLTGDLV